MRSIKFWKTEIQQLSSAERQFFSGAIETLFTWKLLKQEYGELDLIRRILETEAGESDFPQQTQSRRENVLFGNHRLRQNEH